MYEGGLLRKTPAERRETWRRIGGTLLGGTLGLVGCIVGFLVMVVVGGFIISIYTHGLAGAWDLLFDH